MHDAAATYGFILASAQRACASSLSSVYLWKLREIRIRLREASYKDDVSFVQDLVTLLRTVSDAAVYSAAANEIQAAMKRMGLPPPTLPPWPTPAPPVLVPTPLDHAAVLRQSEEQLKRCVRTPPSAQRPSTSKSTSQKPATPKATTSSKPKARPKAATVAHVKIESTAPAPTRPRSARSSSASSEPSRLSRAAALAETTRSTETRSRAARTKVTPRKAGAAAPSQSKPRSRTGKPESVKSDIDDDAPRRKAGRPPLIPLEPHIVDAPTLARLEILRSLPEQGLCPHLERQAINLYSNKRERLLAPVAMGALKDGRIVCRGDEPKTFKQFFKQNIKNAVPGQSPCAHIYIVSMKKSLDLHLLECSHYAAIEASAELGDETVVTTETTTPTLTPRTSRKRKREAKEKPPTTKEFVS
ncbi:hypothetical protein SPRG_02544 [Saprolegnia parasitica CBS 223.65]|uniref:Uncharacterized protein n=1 Tax=Saprolegnia parasitica (strain CBS 223.65) TaxID=695850 RepID=A0A067D1E1_SAPPC|nr:hypothetical protein SPRG_02544 [Saprolegnia parasitica CBS 223.65]KDO32852.1 hypothetical protein SPRG_02544 [Saprolegnia parasitica CBS 223.65]|eukprot:XP_012196505.1 hypothetical protein SPRG_02544 [Saprolegnia parasitica CBS 223.65]